jgi:hypothetical protein
MDEPRHPHEEQINRSWNANAKPWARAIQTGSIQSRTLVTDRAIIEAVSSMAPRRVLDVGCGEGWLARALSARGMTVTGVDAVAAGGYLIVQTLHPLAACGDNPYRDGWSAGNWLGFGAAAPASVILICKARIREHTATVV